MNIFSEVPSCLIKIFGYRPVDQNAHGFGVHSVHKVETPIRDGIREIGNGWGFVALTKEHPSKISWMKWLQ
jgi:hypothetical protein